MSKPLSKFVIRLTMLLSVLCLGVGVYTLSDRLYKHITEAKTLNFLPAIQVAESGSGVGFDSIDLGADVFTANFIGGNTIFLGCRAPIPGSTPVPNLGITQASQLRFGIKGSPGNSCDADPQAPLQEIFVVATVMGDPSQNLRNTKELCLRLPISVAGQPNYQPPCNKIRCSNGAITCDGQQCPSPNFLCHRVNVAFISNRQVIGQIGPEGIKTFMLDPADTAELQQLITDVGANNLRIGVNVYDRSYSGQDTLFAYEATPPPFTISPASTSFPHGFPGPTPIPGSVTVTAANSSCYWREESDDLAFINIPAITNPPSGGSSGIGSGTARYSVNVNDGPGPITNGFVPRTGKIRIGGQTLTVNQAGRCPNINPLTVGSTPVSGQLSGTDCQSSSGGLADYYSFSGIAGQQIAINLNSTAFIPRLILYDPRGVREEYDDNFGGGSSASIPINGGFHTLWMTGTYTIAVTSSGGTGAYALRLRGAEGACTTIAPIEIAQSVTGQLSTTDCRLSIDNSFVDFYSFSGTAGQQIAINLNSSAFNAFLLLYDPDGNLIASDDNGGGGTNARIPAGSGFFTLPATGTYLVGANSFAAGQTGAYTLWLSSNCQGIATNPTDKVVCAGSNVSFTAAVSGPFTGVRWEESPPGCVRRFIDITGNPTATTTTLTLTGVTTARNGSRYRAVFTGMCGTATSAVATLTVNAATGIASQPSSQTVCAGAATSFSVTASGTGPFTYQWRKNGANIAGATGSSYSIASVTAANAGSYSVVVTGACGSATSNAATLTVNTPPNITTQPANQTVAAGGGVSFTAAAGGNPVPTVQWQVSTNSGVSFSNITGATSATLMLTNVNAALNGNRYRAVFTNSCNSATTTAATLTVTCPAITLSPTNPTLPAGRAGDQYSQTFTATGGTAPYVFSVSAGLLPPGLSLSSGGVFSGAPTGFGTFNFTIKATDVNDCMGARAYTLVINPPCPAITVNPSSLPNGAVGVGYNQTVSATGGTPPYTFTIISGGLPAGLTLSPAGVISGTPSSGGTFGFTIKATDANGCMGTRGYTVTISGTTAGLQFYPLARPVRLLDTRAGQTGCDAPGAQIPGGTSRTQTAAGRTCDGLLIPAAARAITGNITTVQSGGGYLTLYPSDAAQPTVANSNYNPNEILNNVFTVGLGAGDGAFKIFVTSNTDVVVDVSGYFAPPGAGGLYFHPLPRPVRLLETRAGFTGCFAPGTPLPGNFDTTQQATGACAGLTIPAAAKAITGNATTVNPLGPGSQYFTLFPADAARPLAASSNYLPGQIMNAPFTVGLSPGGAFKIYPTTQTDLVIDVSGYYSAEASDANGAGLLFYPLARPVRLLETRPGFGGCYTPGAPLTGGGTRTQPARGVCDGLTVPANAAGIIGNATVVGPAGGGYLTFWPSGAAQPTVAASNYTAGQVFNRHFTVGQGAADGAFNIFTLATTHLVIDLSGYFAP